jgi:Rieske 2Fe-2S family protein
VSLLPDAMLTWRLVPLGATRTRVVAELAVHEAAVRSGGDNADLLELWDRTSAEDRAMCERQQRGLDAGAESQFAYAPGDEAVHAFDRWVAGSLLEAIGLREREPPLEATFDGSSHGELEGPGSAREDTMTLALDTTTTEDR